MTTLNPKTFVRDLKGAPLSILWALWAFGPLNQAALARKTGYSTDVVGPALQLLEHEYDLIIRPHYRVWSLGPGALQLPLPWLDLLQQGVLLDGSVDNSANTVDNLISIERPETRENRFSVSAGKPETRENRLSDFALVSETREKRLSGSAARPETRENRLSESPTSGSDQIRSDQMMNDEELSNDPDLILTASGAFLDRLGIGGEFFEKLSALPLDLLVGSYWYVCCIQNVNDEAAYLRTHLISRRRTPAPYIRLANWYTSGGRLIDLVDFLRGDHSERPDGLKRPLLDTARRVYLAGGFDDFIN